MPAAPLGAMLLQDFTPRETATLAQRIEELGYESLWFADAWGQDPLIRIAACAPVTSRIRLGTGVLNAFTRHPLTLALASLSLADLTEGRFLLGLGTSHPEMVDKAMGVPFKKPLTRIDETLTVVRALLQGAAVDFEGQTLRLKGRLATRTPYPVPIYLGAVRPKMLHLAGEKAEGVYLNYLTPETMPAVLGPIREGLAAAGRPAGACQAAGFLAVAVVEDVESAEKARNAMRRGLDRYLGFEIYRARWRALGFHEEVDRAEALVARGETTQGVVSDAMLDAAVIIGDCDTCRARLEALRSAGLELPVIQPLSGRDPERFLRTLESLAPR